MDISAEMALRLKQAGLIWQPKRHDYFSIPNTELADRVFVLTDMMTGVEVLHGYQAITFNGATEWALDYVFIQEVLWMPSEAQIRELLVDRLGDDASMMLGKAKNQYVCQIQLAEEPLNFYAPSAANAYALAYLFLIQN